MFVGKFKRERMRKSESNLMMKTENDFIIINGTINPDVSENKKMFSAL